MPKIKPSQQIKKQIAIQCQTAYKAGKSITPIVEGAAEKFGYSTKTVYRWIKKFGCQLNRKVRSDAGKRWVHA